MSATANNDDDAERKRPAVTEQDHDHASCKKKKPALGGPAKPDDCTAMMIKLKVGDSVFETTQEELTGCDENSYFHALFSGRWNGSENDTYDIQERSGRLFQFVLYYLQFGDVPRQLNGCCALDDATLSLLKEEAEYYGLDGLTAICGKSGRCATHQLLQGISPAPYDDTKVSFFVPSQITDAILVKLKASQARTGEDRNKHLYEWHIAGEATEPLSHVVAEGLDTTSIPADATEEWIMNYLKTGKLPNDEFETKYMLVSQLYHKYGGQQTFVVVLSKPEHMALYHRISDFVKLEKEALGPPYDEGLEVLHPRLFTKAFFVAKGGWNKYSGFKDYGGS